MVPCIHVSLKRVSHIKNAAPSSRFVFHARSAEPVAIGDSECFEWTGKSVGGVFYANLLIGLVREGDRGVFKGGVMVSYVERKPS